MIDDIHRLCDQVHDVMTLAETPPSGNTSGGSPMGGSKPPVPVGFLDAKIGVKNTISSWALMISEEGEFVIDCEDDAMSIAAWVYSKADWLAGHPAVEDFITEMKESMDRLKSFYKPRRDDRKYLGEYLGVQVYVKPSQELVEIPGLGMQRVETVRDWQRRDLLNAPVSAFNAADYISNVLGLKVDAKKITTMVSDDKRRGRDDPLVPVSESPLLFRIGDVVTRLQSSRKARANAV